MALVESYKGEIIFDSLPFVHILRGGSRQEYSTVTLFYFIMNTLCQVISLFWLPVPVLQPSVLPLLLPVGVLHGGVHGGGCGSQTGV